MPHDVDTVACYFENRSKHCNLAQIATSVTHVPGPKRVRLDAGEQSRKDGEEIEGALS